MSKIKVIVDVPDNNCYDYPLKSCRFYFAYSGKCNLFGSTIFENKKCEECLKSEVNNGKD